MQQQAQHQAQQQLLLNQLMGELGNPEIPPLPEPEEIPQPPTLQPPPSPLPESEEIPPPPPLPEHEEIPLPPSLQDIFGDLEDLEPLPEIDGNHKRSGDTTPNPPTPKRSRVDLSLLPHTPVEFDLSLLPPTPPTEVVELLSPSSTPLSLPPSPIRHMPVFTEEDLCSNNLSPPTSPLTLPPRTPPGMEALTADDFFDSGKQKKIFVCYCLLFLFKIFNLWSLWQVLQADQM